MSVLLGRVSAYIHDVDISRGPLAVVRPRLRTTVGAPSLRVKAARAFHDACASSSGHDTTRPTSRYHLPSHPPISLFGVGPVQRRKRFAIVVAVVGVPGRDCRYQHLIYMYIVIRHVAKGHWLGLLKYFTGHCAVKIAATKKNVIHFKISIAVFYVIIIKLSLTSCPM